jgi:Putative 8-oxoguanine DNA glycosylase OGG-like protein
VTNPDRSWTEDQLRRAVRRWEKRLAEQGKTELTIRTYIRDANAYLDDLTGNATLRGRSSLAAGTRNCKPATKLAAAKSGSRSTTVSAHRRSGRPLGARRPMAGPIPTPRTLHELYRLWVDGGRKSQRAIRWPRERWVAMLPEHEPFLVDALPDCLDRASVRRISRDAARGEEQAVHALLAVLAWGMGDVGTGPWRGYTMLSCRPDAAACLREVAATLHTDGPVAAYKRLKGDCRLDFLGPSFGTKYLALAQASGASPVALIHDDLIRDWLRVNGRADLVVSYYSVPVYEAYLAQMQAWADELGTDPETVEYVIFQAESGARGNQWSRLGDCLEP